ncbi:MAG: YhbY family RNA-binding protein [Candidatus Thermoplasmatota archaeon]|nr:YhbY family RNA-binding protein [Candidatus Thermoplasmatota archaeon]
MDVEEAKIEGQDLQATLHVGKEGITRSLLNELDNQLEKRGLVKVKVNRNDPTQNVEKTAEELEKSSIGELIEVRGKTVLLLYEE